MAQGSLTEVREPCVRLTSLGGWYREEEPPRAFGFEGQWVLITGLGETETPVSEGAPKVSCVPGPMAKQ